ncbi:hypothetical protein HYI43_00465 [Staphylococcus taiwanensis]|nr:hypothetical protein HYI43_00465 [Staphylococcus taiwanensis]
MALINYHFKNFIRSYKWIGPSITFLILLAITYFYSGQPIMSSFASTSMLLLFITAWLTIIILDTDSIKEKQLLFTQLKTKGTYLTSKLIFSFLVILPLGLCAIILPIITFRFEQMPNLMEIVLGLYSHAIVIALGVIMTTLVRSITKRSDKFIWLFIVLILLLSILRVVIIQTFPISKFVLWFLPPISDFLTLLNHASSKIFDISFLFVNLWMIGYLIVMWVILYVVFNKSEYL